MTKRGRPPLNPAETYPVEEWARRRAEGVTLQTLATEAGISRERVRQILKETGHGSTASMARAARTAATTAAHEQRRDEVRQEVLRLYGTMRTVAIARRLGVPQSDVFEIVRDAFGPARSASRRAVISNRMRAPTLSEDEISAGIRAAWKVLQRTDPTETVLTRRRYEQLAAWNHLPVFRIEDVPHWTVACERAGVPAGYRPYRSTTREECTEAVRRCQHDLGVVPTIEQYVKWRSNGGSGPGASMVRRLLGGWSGVIHVLTADLTA